jgi:hypothetical protein
MNVRNFAEVTELIRAAVGSGFGKLDESESLGYV